MNIRDWFRSVFFLDRVDEAEEALEVEFARSARLRKRMEETAEKLQASRARVFEKVDALTEESTPQLPDQEHASVNIP